MILSSVIGEQNKIIRVGKFKLQKKLITGLVDGEKVVDMFEGMAITWELLGPKNSYKSYFGLSFEH